MEYITIIKDESDDDWYIGYDITSNLIQHQEFKAEMLACNGIKEVKILKIQEVD